MPMRTKAAIVTGTSRGIGEALGAALLEQGYRVYGVSRSESQRLHDEAHYTAMSCDLSDAEQVGLLAERLFREYPLASAEELLLINNAAMQEPLRPLEAVSVTEMTDHIQTSLLAPMALCSAFIRNTASLPMLKRIVNVTSGLALYSAPSMSLYCSSKAALNMLTRCIADEQRDRPYPVFAYAVDPGMTETQMQVTARSQPKGDFPYVDFFRESHEQGELRTSDEVAAEILRLLAMERPNGSLLRVSD
ncbi:SDR family NAD(P)-dependent oxidoreductase [Paenibacillus sp. R14(2021)]|uniref:SDR family NAD(P)-dependent oxidoreductase n=1 Tax=Paenibacillus sp. R14(2021) TaxID=2859228 RepID=UPI001C613980|nr:SDR family NAD(P)-dependent oxidoreductase [Paenibacillus sp. R14(2021)]